VGALIELLSVPQAPSSGSVVASDLETVGVDRGSVPIDEVLAFRREHTQNTELMREQSESL
jgi:hypothetical protein